MGNLVALRVHLRPGDSILAPADAHIFDNEVGTVSWLAGGFPKPLECDHRPGVPSAETVSAAATATGPYFALRPTLLCLENTHAAAGGAVVTADDSSALVAAARSAGLTTHLDGARIWNAAVHLGVDPGELTSEFDTVQVCLSKGLGAPVGSVVCGSEAFVTEARRVRKMLGGGVRQAGILGAAGLVALERIDRLALDHHHASVLADGLLDRGWTVSPVTTNIVMTPVDNPVDTAESLSAVGIRVLPSRSAVRWMTYSGVSLDDVHCALDRVTDWTSSAQQRAS